MSLKQAFNGRGWKGRVFVSRCVCMGLGADGPNLILYPQKVWYTGVTPADVDTIVSRIEALPNASSRAS